MSHVVVVVVVADHHIHHHVHVGDIGISCHVTLMTYVGQPAYEAYLHRIGRSARFGRKGIAFNFTSGSRESSIIDDISRHYQKEIKAIQWDDEDRFIEALEEAGLA